MKTVFACVMLFASLLQMDLIAKQTAADNLELRIADVSRSGQIRIQVQNSSREPARVWRESNSWGASRWRVLVLRNGQIDTFYQNPNKTFTRNIPTFDVIPAGGHLDIKLDLNGGNWCGWGHCSSFDQRGIDGKNVSFESADRLVVLYDVPHTQEGMKMSVWQGVASASAVVQ